MNVYNREDGVSVVELDPTKKYWVIVPHESGIDPSCIRNIDGLILLPKTRNHGITFIENTNGVEVKK